MCGGYRENFVNSRLREESINLLIVCIYMCIYDLLGHSVSWCMTCLTGVVLGDYILDLFT